MDIKEILADFAAFADSEDAVAIEKGEVIFQRDRQMIACKLVETSSGIDVNLDGRVMPYRRFLAEELGRMSVLAQALKEKRKDVTPYIDTRGVMTSSLGETTNSISALDTLGTSCVQKPFGETKLVFLTADAGHGKTALLRRLTRKFANDYLEAKSDILLFHIDTQGRSFVRLEEAVARDLGQLRIFGLFYPGVLRLVRSGLLTLAIDGFDELLAEIGVGEAYSGLGALLRQLDGRGVVLASARSAYFEVENYAAQARLLTANPETHVVVEHMRLEPWGSKETIQYFSEYESETGSRISDPQRLYEELSDTLGDQHPVLRRPFLVYRMAALLADNAQAVADLTRELGEAGLQVVPKVINALLKREVEEKWRDPNGQPYLTVDQHVVLLSAVADEMWTQGKSALPVEVVQLVCETVIEVMQIPPAHRVQIVQRIRAHALLPPLGNGDLSFDHEEFLNFFLASRLTQLLRGNDRYGLQRFCEIHPLPPNTALWAATEAWSGPEAIQIISRLSDLTRGEVRSSYLKQNAGLVAAYLASRYGHNGFSLSFEHMYFEGEAWSQSQLQNGIFKGCTFIGLDLSGAKWENCRFDACSVDGLILDEQTKLQDCQISPDSIVLGVLKRRTNDEPGLKSYSPEVCRMLLEQAGAGFEESEGLAQKAPSVPPVKQDLRQTLAAFLRVFERNSGATENVARLKLGSRYPTFQAIILPALLRHNIVRPTEYRGGGQQQRWELNYPVEAFLRAEDPRSNALPNLIAFWSDLRK